MIKLKQLIEQLCPDGVEYKSLACITTNITDGMHSLPNKIVTNSAYPILSAQNINHGKIDFITNKYVSKETYDKENKRTNVRTGDVLLTIVGAIGRVAVVEKDITALFQRSICVIKLNRSLISSYYLRYALESRPVQEYMIKNAHGAAQKGLYLKEVSKILIHVPPLEVQAEIVRILDTFTEFTTELTTELANRKKQYEYYRDILLKTDAPHYMLEDICDIVDYRGKTPKKVDEGIFLVTAKNIRKGYIDYEKSQEYVNPDDYAEIMRRGLPKIGDVLITTEAPCGNVAQIDREDVALAQRVIKYRPKNEALNSSYLKYVLLGEEFQRKLMSAATGGTVKGIKGSKLHKLTIPVPPIEEQRRIVEILDRFDKLCNDISEGLPAEIEARQKQYEYYRDKLLTFKELK